MGSPLWAGVCIFSGDSGNPLLTLSAFFLWNLTQALRDVAERFPFGLRFRVFRGNLQLSIRVKGRCMKAVLRIARGLLMGGTAVGGAVFFLGAFLYGMAFYEATRWKQTVAAMECVRQPAQSADMQAGTVCTETYDVAGKRFIRRRFASQSNGTGRRSFKLLYRKGAPQETVTFLCGVPVVAAAFVMFWGLALVSPCGLVLMVLR